MALVMTVQLAMGHVDANTTGREDIAIYQLTTVIALVDAVSMPLAVVLLEMDFVNAMLVTGEMEPYAALSKCVLKVTAVATRTQPVFKILGFTMAAVVNVCLGIPVTGCSVRQSIHVKLTKPDVT